LPEKELILQARRGDEHAWAELMHQHQQAVFRLAYLHLGDAAEAEDAAQECFIRAYHSLDRFDASRPLRPWLLRIVTNLAHNRRRSAGRYWAALLNAAQAQPPADTRPEDASAEQTKADELWSAVKKLPASMQSILYLRFFLEASIEETAQVLNLAEGTVKSQTHRALEKLRHVIQEKYPLLWEEWK
jgi:RNA polymerase sigma-70 factor (ECF subfamily)